MFEVRDGLFEFVVQGQCASQSPHAVRAGAEFVHRFFCGFIDARMSDQSQITIRGVHAHLTSIDQNLRIGKNLLRGLVVKIKVICFQMGNAIRHGFDAAGHSVIGVVKIHGLPPKLECCKFSLGVWFCLVECEERVAG